MICNDFIMIYNERNLFRFTLEKPHVLLSVETNRLMKRTGEYICKVALFTKCEFPNTVG